MRHRWTDPNVQAELAAQSAMGLSATEIARSMGETKDAVASAMSRHGLFAFSRPGRAKVTLPSIKGFSDVH